jgi:SnoaL-like domain/EF hand
MHFKQLALLLALGAASVVAVAQATGKAMDVSPFFAEVDTNKDGCASLTEWKRAGAPLSSFQGLKDARGCVTLAKMNSTAAPDGIDTDGDGKLTLAELKVFDRKMAPLMAKMKNQPKVDKAAEALEIQNLMSRRMFYHSVGRNELELALWSKTQPIRWAQNQGCWLGMDSLKVYYDDVNRQMQAAELTRLSQANPAIKNVPENRFIGNTILHTLTTPIIEIAGDGQSAKGVWYTPGAILAPGEGKGAGEAMWIWERYGVDLIKEEGRWALLHVQVNTDFAGPIGQPLSKQGFDAAAMGSEGGAQSSAPAVKVPGPDVAVRIYEEFGPTRLPRLEPRLPEPYRTLSETFQYADCNPSARGS